MGRIKIGKGLLYYVEHPYTVKFHTITLKRLEKMIKSQVLDQSIS